jgi:hypothetical protein
MTAIEIPDLLYIIKNEHVAKASLSLSLTFNKFIEKERVFLNYLNFNVTYTYDSTV